MSNTNKNFNSKNNKNCKENKNKNKHQNYSQKNHKKKNNDSGWSDFVETVTSCFFEIYSSL